jgi:hypothetical protein
MQARQVALGIAAGGLLVVAGWWAGARSAPNAVPAALGVTPAWAGEIESVKAGEMLISTDGGNAYLWRRNGERIELVGQCVRTMGGPEDQATFVWLPGVERRS